MKNPLLRPLQFDFGSVLIGGTYVPMGMGTDLYLFPRYREHYARQERGFIFGFRLFRTKEES